MNTLALSPIGLLLAAAMSVINVLTDVCRKHALEKRDLLPATFWIRTAVAAVFCIVLAARVAGGAHVEIRGGVGLFTGLMALDVGLITIVTRLYFRALQISPLSMCIPFLAFTPVFLIPTTYVILGQKPQPIKVLGVLLIVTGSLVMHRQLFAVGWLAPVKAVIEYKGSRYMLLVALVFSLTNPLDAKLVAMSDVYTEACVYGLGLSIAFYLLARAQRCDFGAAARGNFRWIALAGVCDAVSLLFQLASYAYIAVVITVSIKRAGIVLAVLAGWLFFREREITDKVIAASVMFCGVLILYLPLGWGSSLILMAATLAGMAIALYTTRKPA
ncbi:MAG TPA: EamA family transporter [Candidatus Acidoferrales bacterium]|nr:EamA family transporter [Bryobacteraceae bacterium]HTS61142.1 EamA family transporter [Candidatus Acidoferrales bacterium]